MKAALYARVSTMDKDQNPEVQLEKLREYCRSMGYEIFKEYVDFARAADLVNRTAWIQLMKDASIRKFDLLLIWRLDRAFRSNVHACNSLELLRRYGINFKSYSEPGMDTNTPHGELFFNMAAAYAQFESQLISQRVTIGMDYARAHGTRSGLPIGKRSYDIALQTICKAVDRNKNAYGTFNFSAAARELAEKCHIKGLTAGFVSLRITRAIGDRSITREEFIKEVLEGR